MSVNKHHETFQNCNYRKYSIVPIFSPFASCWSTNASHTLKKIHPLSCYKTEYVVDEYATAFQKLSVFVVAHFPHTTLKLAHMRRVYLIYK